MDVKSLSNVVSGSRVVASGWIEVSLVVNTVREREVPPPFFLFCYALPFIVLLCTYFSFVLFFSLLPLSLCPALYSTFQPDVPNSARGIFSMQ